MNKLRKYGVTDAVYEQKRAAGLRWCYRHKDFLSPESFYGPKSSLCVSCQKLWAHEKWQGTSKTKRRKQNPEDLRRWFLKRKYNVTPEWYETMLRLQNGVCAICEKADKKRLSVDHNHKTGEPRGLLCTRCNTALERVEEIGNWLRKAEAYLQTHAK